VSFGLNPFSGLRAEFSSSLLHDLDLSPHDLENFFSSFRSHDEYL